MVRLAAIGLLLFSTLFSIARADVPAYWVPQQYVSPRALGMGNAFISVADDYNALLYNPAGLARLSEGELNLYVGGAMDSKVLKFYNDVNTASKSSDSTTDLANLISSNAGNHYYLRAPQLGGVLVRPKWGIAIIPFDLELDMDIHQNIGPTIDVTAVQDTTIAFGFATNIRTGHKDKLSIGTTVKGIYRAYYSQAILAPQLALNNQIFNKDAAQEGGTLDADVGMMYTPNVSRGGSFHFMRAAVPTFALTVQNVGDYGFPWSAKVLNPDKNPPPRLERRVNVGANFEFPSFWVFEPRFAIEEHDMLEKNFTPLKGFHAGVELSWKVRSWLQGGYRAGYSQGYFAVGASAKLGIFMLEIASWGEEIGTVNVHRENRRYIARASLDF